MNVKSQQKERLHKMNNMNQEILSFCIGVFLLISYLIFSAFTEMGTKLPGKNNKDNNE